MVLFYLLILTFIALVAIGGYDATMRLVRFLELSFEYHFIIKPRMYFMKRKLEKELGIDRKQSKKY
jgi:hypothetical protein|tara:strand:+ start:481 stop:678 length:198 start_codon:yes stop_codon:yes gene_type:complete